MTTDAGPALASPKRPAPTTEDAQTPPTKKIKVNFSPKEFRKQLKTDQRNHALQQFLQLTCSEDGQKYVLSYLEHGGSPLELLQTLEGESGASPLIVFDIVNRILLQISAKLAKYQSAAYDACRFLLNAYISQINKMLGLSSSMNERVVVLKLLTTMVTCSVVLAKDVLLNVNFHKTNLELLTKVSEGNNEARGAFILFITAFLVDGHFPPLSVLLEKRGLMTSIVNGLQYDTADVVVLVLTALKNHILENAFVSKSVKMSTFNTAVVKDIVNLYNWKGPAALQNQKKKTNFIPVDEIDKSKINEAVHSFLLVLCTSHKFGVIFRDSLIGLGGHQNTLMFSVLESLVRPWEHSYAGELVIKICKACPDLSKRVWINLKPSLVPRWTDKWLKSMQFAGRLVDQFQPECIELGVNNFTGYQVAQLIMSLTAPYQILKTVLPEKQIFDRPATKYHVMLLLLKMATTVATFLERAKTWTNFNYSQVYTNLSRHINKNFPGVDTILTNWDQVDENLDISDYVDVAFDLLAKYKVLAPKILTDGSVNFDVCEFIAKSETIAPESRTRLQVKAVDFFVDLDPSSFRSKMELFKNVVMFTTEYYYNCKDVNVLRVLKHVLRNCGIFDACLPEIDFWIDGFLNLKSYDADVAIFLCDLIRHSEENVKYQKQVFELKANFSPLVLSLGDFFTEIDPSKGVKNYLSFVLLSVFHIQIELNVFIEALAKFTHLPEALTTYFSTWSKMEVAVLSKCKGKLMEQMHNFSETLLEGRFKNVVFDLYPNQKLNMLQGLIFYVTNLVKTGNLTEQREENCSKILTFLIKNNVFEDDRCVRVVLGNPTLLQNFTFLNKEDFSTKFILDVVKCLKQESVDDYLSEFRRRVVSTITKMFKKSEKYQNSIITTEVLELMNLDYEHCQKLLSKFVACGNKNFYSVACYCLNRIVELGKNYDLEPLSGEVVQELSRLLSSLLTDAAPNVNLFSSAFLNYLKIFPHNLENVDVGLFDSLVSVPEFNKDNLLLCEFLLDRKPECKTSFEKNLDEICLKRSFILALLDVVLRQYQNDEVIWKKIFNNIESYVVKALQKPHKAGQHFQNRHHSLGVLVEKFMETEAFGSQVQKFETTELFHVHLLKKIYDKIEKNDKTCGNMIITFVHLMMNLLKQKSGYKEETLSQVGGIFLDFLRNVGDFNGASLSTNETLKIFCKLCLKHGITGDPVLFQILSEVSRLCLEEDDGKLVLEMLFSHSQFLEVIIGDSRKLHIITLWKVICTKWPQLMDRSHIPVLLASYKAINSESEILALIKMYESNPDQTKFFDFKPFLWSRAAASHYSVRANTQKALWQQPKVADVLNNLQQSTIASTITDPSNPNSYDLDFFLPLFSHLLVPENPVPTYMFSRTGALALTLTGFRGDKKQRFATCHVLQRFHFHLEARQTGKDNLLWLRLIEAVCKGVAVLDDFKINNFVGVFLGRMALVFTQPTDVMYVPLSQYLSAKDSLDFRTIPELYTFLHSPHVDSKKHKHFILQVLRNGLRDEKDFKALIKSMGFKLISELCSSTVCEVETKVLILEIIDKCCELELGVKVLCGSMSLLSQLASLIVDNIKEGVVLLKLLGIILKIVEMDDNRHRNFLIYVSLTMLFENDHYFRCLSNSRGLMMYYRILMTIVKRYPEFFTTEHMENILEKSKDGCCKYLVLYGCQFFKDTDFANDSTQCLRLLFYNKLHRSDIIAR